MDNKKKNFDFVMRHYQQGKFDTQKALRTLFPDTHRRFSILKVAAVVAALAIISAMVLMRERTIRLAAGQEMAVFMLPDSSRITLAPHATVAYKKRDCRTLHLTGKAYFEVKHDEVHPFIVEGSTAHVRVLGTKFQVEDSEREAIVSVTQGRVSLAGLLLAQGQCGVMRRGGKPQLQEATDLQLSTIWATQQWHFDNTPLSEVLRQMTQYYGKRFTTTNPEKRLTGDFDAKDMQLMVDIIEQTLETKINVNP